MYTKPKTSNYVRFSVGDASSTCIGSGVMSEGLVVGYGGLADGLGGGLSALIQSLSIDGNRTRLYLGSIDHMMQGFSDKYLELQISDQDLTGFHESRLNGGCHQAMFLGIFSFLFLNLLPSDASSTCIASGVMSEGLVVGYGGLANGLGGGLSALIQSLSIDGNRTR
ncbi:hypothetical protein DY000_02016308 [Brassica cretica]|uniref:Uncharacterized protein n=1 Tax=Brassica cretica TaxID=69181 RepID=A0ABQ7D105_BRACR|nr:hypothetical protein DY000_02016308 [Brassica cretica]